MIDDCSHQYEPTRESFEILFPLLRPGGWYIIEDWAWDLQRPFQDKEHPWGVHPALHPLVLDIVRANPSRPDLVRSLRVYPDFVAVERGPGDARGFTLAGSIARRPRPVGEDRLPEGPTYGRSREAPDERCPRGDLNPHALIRALAPQASASANSATRTSAAGSVAKRIGVPRIAGRPPAECLDETHGR